MEAIRWRVANADPTPIETPIEFIARQAVQRHMDLLDEPEAARTPMLIRARATWRDEVVFVCRKCMRKQRKGVDGDGTSLRKWLRRALKQAGLGKRVRVLETSCFDLCPKRGVALARGRDLADAAKPLRVLRDGDDPALLLTWLGDLHGD